MSHGPRIHRKRALAALLAAGLCIAFALVAHGVRGPVAGSQGTVTATAAP